MTNLDESKGENTKQNGIAEPLEKGLFSIPDKQNPNYHNHNAPSLQFATLNNEYERRCCCFLTRMAGLGHHVTSPCYGHSNRRGFEASGERFRFSDEVWPRRWKVTGEFFVSVSAMLVLMHLFLFDVSDFVDFQGNFGHQEDKKHRATYKALPDSEAKLKFYSARQIACRVLGSKGYLCQKVLFNLIFA